LQHEFEKRRQDHSVEVAHVKSAGLQAEENQRQVNVIKQVGTVKTGSEKSEIVFRRTAKLTYIISW
jgi:hypothetical protein